ncbi:extracellular solute-binding protein [Methyloferula stellata]|uniref:extracellular solute-binding protein n=1 Tax=Methyloferula stellata TaxID=876270 RepID=UPI00035D7344|nr:extracellular solute-binding protein [Methyloferula stellata]
MALLVSRRSALHLGTAALAGLTLPSLTSPWARKSFAAEAETAETETHGVSVFGDLALPADFPYFPYVNPEAPKGGTVSRELFGTFDSLNDFILRGDPAAGMDMTFDSLMKSSLDEHDALYGLVARAVRISPDKLTYRFLLRKEARFHDGSPLTAKDVVFSLETLKAKGHPRIRQYLRDLVSAVAEADDTVVVTLAKGRSRDLPLLVAGYPIFSAAYYAKHPFEETTLDPPLGSGPYKVGRLEQGHFISFERVADYWAKDLPVNRGQSNFDLIRFDYYSDRSVAFEAFKAGAFTVHEEFTSANWAKGYDFPAMRDGRVIRETIPDENISGIQGWFFNIRRPAFKDPRIREAIGTAFDFKWTNANLMYGSYERTTSYFENSDMEAKGLPDAEELALLEPFRDKVPAEVFGQPYVPPESTEPGQPRDLLRKANELLLSAGCKRQDTLLLLPDGKPFKFEFLYDERGLEPHTQSFIRNLRQLGIDANIRVVDAAQYKQRMDDFDFDVTTERLVMSFSPGEELRSRFGSELASVHGSSNVVGIQDPVVDALIAKALVANSRDELVHICRALDRVLRAGRYWVPHWYKPTHWIAHWDVFSRPDKTPRYDPGIVSTWWYDESKAKRIKFAG